MTDLPPADWHPDPHRRHELRYWDGTVWTAHVSDAGVQTTESELTAHPIPSQAGVIDPRQSKIDRLAMRDLSMRLGVRRELRNLVDRLHTDEEPLRLARGALEGRQGVIALTDRRLLFIEEGVARRRVEDFPITSITSIQTSSGMVSGIIRVFVGAHAAELKEVLPKGACEKIVAGVRQLQEAARSPDVAARPVSVLDRLEQLGRLRDGGVLSAEEFDQQKAAILRGG